MLDALDHVFRVVDHQLVALDAAELDVGFRYASRVGRLQRKQKLHRLHLPIPADPTEVAVKDYKNTEGEAQKLIFRTSAECKSFVRQKLSHPCESRGHGRGPQVNSM